MIHIGERRVDPLTGEVDGGVGGVGLTDMELAMLRYLTERPGELVSREELYERVWGYAKTVRSRAADVAMTRLRAKLEVDPKKPAFFRTVRGVGYRYDPSAARDEGFFVGRTALLEQLGQRRDRVTVVLGPGGAGKSSLVRRALGGKGTWVTLDRGAELRTALAEALGVSRADDASLALALQGRSERIVLDGAESQVGAVSALLASLSEHPFWVTSRVAIPGFDGVHLPPLSRDDAARLFRFHAERARGRGLGSDEDASVDELVTSLDGNCLALELAGGRASVLSVADLVGRLDSAQVLGGGDDGPHASMERVLATSWSLLSPGGRRVLEALSLFSGRFDVADAEAVGPATLDDLQELVDASLVRSPAAGHFELPVLVKMRAAREREELDAARRFVRHLATHGDAARAVHLSPDHAIRARDQLGPTRLDLAHALDLAIQSEDADTAARCLLGLQHVLRSAGRAVSAEQIRAVLGKLPSPGWDCWVRFVQAVVIARDRADASTAITCGLDAARGADDRIAEALLLGVQALEAVRAVSRDEEKLLDAAQAAADGTGVAWIRGAALSMRGIWYRRQHRFAEADRAYARAAALFRDADHRVDEAIVLASRAVLETSRGRVAVACRHAKRSAELHLEVENRLGAAYALHNLGMAQLAAGEPEQAKKSMDRALEHFASAGARGPRRFAQAGLAEVLYQLGRTEDAMVLWETAHAAGIEQGWAELEGVALAGLAMAEALLGEVPDLDRLDEAIELLTRAGTDTELGVARVRRAFVLWQVGERDAGHAALEAALSQDAALASGYASFYARRMDIR